MSWNQLRGTEFFRLWAGETVSLTGAQVTAFALPLVAVITLEATPWQVGLVAAAGSLSSLVFGLFVGVIADRYERLRLMQIANMARMLSIGMLPILYTMDRLTLPVLVAVAFVVGAFSLLFDSAMAGYIPRLIPRSGLTKANSWMQGSLAVGDVAGPGLAGLLVQALGAPYALAVDAVSYLASSAALSKLPKAPPQTGGREAERPLAAVRSGLRMVLRDPVQRPLVLAAAHHNVFNAMFFAVFALYVVRTLHLPVGILGLLSMLIGLGGLLSVSTSERLARRFGYGRTIAISYGAPGLSALAVPLAEGTSRWAIVCLVGFSLFTWTYAAVTNVVLSETVKQVLVPDRFLGRVTSVIRFVSWGIDPIGAVMGGALASSVVGLRGTLLLAAVGLLTSAIWPMSDSVQAVKDIDHGTINEEAECKQSIA